MMAVALGWGAQAAERLPAGASSCTSCHAGAASEIPVLENLTAAEIEAALEAYRSGGRDGTIMPRIAKGFSAAETRAIAASLGRDRQSKP
ncbi:hypothetical protein MGN01_02850 [Methylobacterium gnaphalii]|uniref:Cytochrome c domain-containing protein n=2 Tax=Methylobacterium gnaphalii TaxID=1010610 RepID=A0A512JER1_9HYPH|nr:hypothetical protein MGN01_02850 [Methylobacterium gnaphalii]